MRASRLVPLAAVAVLLVGPAPTAAPAKPKKKAQLVVPSSITIIVGKARNWRFGATGYMEFSEKVTGTARGHWVISDGLGRQRLSFRLRNITDTDYTPFTVVDREIAPMRGKELTAVLVIGKTRSAPVTLIE